MADTNAANEIKALIAKKDQIEAEIKRLMSVLDEVGNSKVTYWFKDKNSVNLSRNLYCAVIVITNYIQSWFQQGHVGMDGPLVDREQFPRSDIDVYTVRQARHKISCTNLTLILRLITNILHFI